MLLVEFLDPVPLPSAARWQEELQEVCAELSLPRPIALHVTQRLGPALCLVPCGYRLLVPQAVWGRLTTQQRRAILRHELAHYVRGDLWKSLFARILAWPQWFNPLAWLAVRRFEEAAEWACDDAALAADGEGAFDYLRALLELGQTNSSTPSLQAAIHGGSLQCRVRRLLSPTGKDSLMKKLVVIFAALALAAGGFARIQFATAQSPTPQSSEGTTAAAKGSAANTPAGEAASVASRDSARPAASAPVQPSQEAVIDLARVFKELHGFNEQMSVMKDRIKKFDEEHKAKVAALRNEQQAASDAGPLSRFNKEATDSQAKLQAQATEAKKEFLQAEAAIYNEVYDQVRAAIAEYAKEHGIRVVRRHQFFGRMDDKVDATDRQAVLARINRDIVYMDGPIDITDVIVQRLNDRTARP